MTPGTKKYSRTFTVKADAAPGSYDVILGLHGGKDIDSGAEWSYTKWQNELTVTQPLTNLVVTIQSPTNGFSVSKGTPTTVSAKITDNLENVITGASLVKATFTNGDDDLVLLDDGAHGDGAASNGVYANTWTPQTTAQGYTETACTIKVTAYHSTLSSGYDEVNGVINSPKLIMIELTPTSHDFGELQTTVSTAPFSFTLKNLGGRTATGEVSLTGSGKDQFIITSGKGSFSLNADQTKTISVAFTPTSAGSKSATLYAKGSNCNDDQSSLSGTGEEGVSTLSADFTIEPSQNINLGDFATFDASSSTGDIVSYKWDFGDGIKNDGIVDSDGTKLDVSFHNKQVRHLFRSTGTFSVTLTIRDSNGNLDDITKTLTVDAKYKGAVLNISEAYEEYEQSYSYHAVYIKYAPVKIKVEKYSNTAGLSGIEVGSAVKHDVKKFFNFNFFAGMVAQKGLFEGAKVVGYKITPLVGHVLTLKSFIDFVEFIRGYNFFVAEETNSEGIFEIHIPYETAESGDVKPDNLQFQKTPEQLIYVSKPDIGLSEDTDQKFAYMKKIDPSALPEGITFYYEPGIQKKENLGDTHPKLEITVKRQIKDEYIPLVDVSICIIVNDMCQSLGSTSSDGSLRLTEDELVHIDPHGTYTLVAGDGIFYSRKKEQFTFNNDGTTHVDIILDKKDLPTIPSYVAIFAKTPREFPNIVTYPHANSIKNFLQNKCIYTEYIDPTNSEIRKNPTTLNEKMQAIISGSDWIIVLCSFEDIQKPFADFNPHFKFSADKKKPEDVLKEGTGWKIIKYTSENIGLSGETSQYLYYIVTEDKTNTVETAVKEFFEIMEQEFRGSNGLDQLISTSIETSPDPPTTNFGTVPKDQTRTWDFFITNSGSDTLTWTITCDQPSWLNVNPTSGSTTTEADVVTVTIDTHDLTPGTHTGHITLTSNGGEKTGMITVNVPPPAQEPKLCTSSDPPTTNFGTVPKDQTRTWDFFITNCGSGTLTWAITCDQPSWLIVNPTSGSTTTEADVVTVTIDTHDLTPGTHTGHITLTSNGGDKTGTITVEVPSKPSTPNVGFKGIVSFPCTYSDFTGQGIEVTNILSDPNGELVKCKYVCTCWTDDTLAQIDIVAPGDEVEVYGTLIDAPDVAAEDWLIVRLETSTHHIVRLKQGSPQLCTWPTTPSHDFGTVAKDQTRTWDFDIRNCGSGTLTWSVSDDKNWMSVYPTSGSTTTERDTVTVTISTSGLSPGTHTGHVTLTSNGGEKTGTITVKVPPPENQPPENPTLTPDRSSPQLAGTTIKWTASATDPDGDTLYYQFRLKGPATGNSWAIKRDWSTARRWTWYTTASDVGESDISVRIRDGHHASTSSYDLKKTVYDYEITADKKRPTATIDSITPNPATQGKDTVSFKGHGYDSDGYIVEYYWKSSKDGKLSSSKEFTKSASNLDVGTHTLSFKVKDDDGLWSDWATKTLKIEEKKEESKYVKFRGVVTWKNAMMGGVRWTVNVDEWISGSISCDVINVRIMIVPGNMGSYDPDISKGDRVEVCGVPLWSKCTVGLNGESYYYIKKV